MTIPNSWHFFTHWNNINRELSRNVINDGALVWVTSDNMITHFLKKTYFDLNELDKVIIPAN